MIETGNGRCILFEIPNQESFLSIFMKKELILLKFRPKTNEKIPKNTQ